MSRVILMLLTVVVAALVSCTAATPTPPVVPPTPTGFPIVPPPVTPVMPVTPPPATSAPTADSSASPSPFPSDLRLALEMVLAQPSYVLRLEASAGRTIDRYMTIVQEVPANSRSVAIETQAGVMRVIIIGDRAWIAPHGGAFTRTSVAEAEAAASVIEVEAVLEPYLGHEVSAILRFVGRDARNGYEAAHYQADPELLDTVFPRAGADPSLDVWTTADGSLVALEAYRLDGSDRVVLLDFERIGDPTIVVDPPD